MKRLSLGALRGRARVHAVRGGVHPKDNKALSAECPIEPIPLSGLLRVPLQQHIGAEAEPVVAKGEPQV